MCLASVYKERHGARELILNNVQRIDIVDGQIVLTDLMERRVAVEGELASVDLVGNTVVVRESAQ